MVKSETKGQSSECQLIIQWRPWTQEQIRPVFYKLWKIPTQTTKASKTASRNEGEKKTVHD